MTSTYDTFIIVLGYVVDVLSGLSIAGALITVLTFTIFSGLRTFPIRLIVYLSWCIAISQLFFLISFYVYDGFFCIPAAMLFHFFFLADFAWSFCVALNFFLMIVKRNRSVEKFEIWYHIGSWIFATGFIVGMAGSDSYGNIGGVCYMTNGVAIFIAFFVPGLVVISANVALFFFIAREIHDTLQSAPQAEKREKYKEFRIYLYMAISIGLPWIFGFLMTLFQASDSSNLGVKSLQSIFLVLFSVTTPLQGFFIFVSYCCNYKVAGKWAGLLGTCIPFFKRWERLGSTRTTGASSRA